MRKRVNVVMELVTDPLILILDEPTSGLDTKTTELLLNILREFAEGTTSNPKVDPSDENEVNPMPIADRHTKRIVVAVLHQPSFEVAQKFTRILGIKARDLREPNKMPVGTVDLPLKMLEVPPRAAAGPIYRGAYLSTMKADGVFHGSDIRSNDMDTYVLSLGRSPLTEQEKVIVAAKIAAPLQDGVPLIRWITHYATVNDSYLQTFAWQFYMSMRRSLSLFQHNWLEFAFIVVLAIVLGFALGFFNRNIEVQKVPPAAFLLILATSLVCLQTGIQMRLKNKPALLREGARGVHTIAIYLGECVVELIWIFAAPALILLFFMAYAVPRAPFYIYYWILWSVAFSASGAGHALAEILANPGTVGVYLNLALALLCGFSPTKKELPVGLTNISFLSFTFEAIVNGEYHYYPPATQLAAQVVLSSTLQVESCTFYNSVTISTPDAPPVVESCPLDCNYQCVQHLIGLCIVWGLAFRMIVVAWQFMQVVGLEQRLNSFFSPKTAEKGVGNGAAAGGGDAV